MTTHPDAAMTREQVLEEALRQVQNASDLCHAYDIARAALASAQQEPSPAADAEGVAREYAPLFYRAGYDKPTYDEHIKAYEELIVAALRRYAGEGVTDERERLAKMIEEYCMERKPGGERVVLAVAASIVRRGRRLTAEEQFQNLQRFMDEYAAEEAAARASGGEGGAR